MNKTDIRIKTLFRYRELVAQLVQKDIKLKYRRSFLGYLWSVLNPLMIMVIMVIVFEQMFRFNIENYPAYVITGQVCFNFLSESTNQAIYSITGNAALLKKTYVPKYVFTLSKITSSCVNLLFSLGALFIVFIVVKVKFSFYILMLPVVLIQLYVFCLGIGLLLSAVNVFFRDIQYIYSAFLTAWNIQWGIKHFNPLYFYVGQFRDVMMHGRMPGAGIMTAGIGSALIAMLLGTLVFLKIKDDFILYI